LSPQSNFFTELTSSDQHELLQFAVIAAAPMQSAGYGLPTSVWHWQSFSDL